LVENDKLFDKETLKNPVLLFRERVNFFVHDFLRLLANRHACSVSFRGRRMLMGVGMPGGYTQYEGGACHAEFGMPRGGIAAAC